MVFAKKSGGDLVPFGLIDDRLQEYLGADDLKGVIAFHCDQDRGRFAVKKIEVSEIDRDRISALGSSLAGYAAKKQRVFAKHIAIYAKYRYTAFRVVDLSDLCWHFLKLDA
jgi:hypothetical protein